MYEVSFFHRKDEHIFRGELIVCDSLREAFYSIVIRSNFLFANLYDSKNHDLHTFRNKNWCPVLNCLTCNEFLTCFNNSSVKGDLLYE